MRSRLSSLRVAAPPLALLLVVFATTVAVQAHLAKSSAFAASPERTADGKVWLLVTSGLLVDHPVVISLVFFAALGGLALAICGQRVFWTAALLGHVGSTLIVYAVLAVTRALDPHAFVGAPRSLDYGVSATSSAWLGAVAAVAWRFRARTPKGRAGIALSCCAVALFAYTVRPGVTVLASEHVVAFVLGIAATVPVSFRALRLRMPALRLRGVTAAAAALVAVAAVPTAFAFATVPTALAHLKDELLQVVHPSAALCVSNWNGRGAALRSTVAGHGFTGASVGTQRRVLAVRQTAGHRRAKWADYCTYTFYGSGSKALRVEAVWRHGHTARWRRSSGGAPVLRAVDAKVTPSGRLRI